MKWRTSDKLSFRYWTFNCLFNVTLSSVVDENCTRMALLAKWQMRKTGPGKEVSCAVSTVENPALHWSLEYLHSHLLISQHLLAMATTAALSHHHHHKGLPIELVQSCSQLHNPFYIYIPINLKFYRFPSNDISQPYSFHNFLALYSI
jgi:hypothetical protein